MDWMLLTELSSMFGGPWRPAAAPPPTGPAILADPTEADADADLWITRQAYEFMAVRSMCERCGARLARKVNTANLGHLANLANLENLDAITVTARCRGWRRHPHTALVSRGRDGLRFGTLEPS